MYAKVLGWHSNWMTKHMKLTCTLLIFYISWFGNVLSALFLGLAPMAVIGG